MKLGIDLCCFEREHRGGKDEVAYNLLRGFEALGYTEDIVCFCHPELVEVVRAISNRVTIYEIPKVKYRSLLRYYGRVREGRAVRDLIQTSGIDALLFTNKESPLVKYPIPTFVITHDIALFRVEFPRKTPTRKIGYLKPPLRTWKNRFYNWVGRQLIQREFKLRDYIFSISDFDKGEIGKFIPAVSEKVKRIYNPIRFAQWEKLDEEKKYIMALNIQWSHKNTKTLVRAFAQIAGEIPLDLILVGKKPDPFVRLEECIQECGVEDRVRFTGFVTEEEMKRIISETRIYVNPSSYEGFGMTAVEMMGHGVPTIVAANTAQPEVTQGLCRYYEPTTDANALAAAILQELYDPTSQECLVKISQQIKNTYDYINISRKYWEFVESKCGVNGKS